MTSTKNKYISKKILLEVLQIFSWVKHDFSRVEGGVTRRVREKKPFSSAQTDAESFVILVSSVLPWFLE